MVRITGFVKDQNGIGVKDVPVSNGEDINRTDKAGRYTLDLTPGTHRFIFLSLPEGCTAPGGWYLRVVNGHLPGAYDFCLDTGGARGRRARIVHITDLHLTLEGNRSWTSSALGGDLKRIAELDSPDLVVATGDLTGKGTQGQLEALGCVIRSSEVRVLPIFGGHDGNEERHRGDPPSNTRNYEAEFGPTYYSFDLAGRHFVAFVKEDYFLSPDEVEMKDRWLLRDLSVQPPGRKVVVLMHTPPVRPFLDLLSEHSVELVLFGHWHSSKCFTYRGITVGATQPLLFGGIDTTPRGYRLLNLRPKGFEMKVRHMGQRHGPLADREEGCIWSRHVDGVSMRASPVAGDGTLLLSLSDEDNARRAGILCLEQSTGRELWRASSDSSIKNSIALAEEADGPVVCGVSVAGRVFLFQGGSGEEIWHSDLVGYPERWVYAAPAVSQGVVYAGAKSGYGAYAIEDGSRIWYREVGPNDAWSCYASPLIRGDLLIVLATRMGIFALDRSGGSVAWETELPVEYHYASPLLVDGLVVSGGERGELVALRVDDGEAVWMARLEGEYPTGLAADGENVLACVKGGLIQSIGLDNGETNWTYRSGLDLLDMTPYGRGTSSILSAPLPLDDRVIVGGCDGNVHILDRLGGGLLRCLSAGSPVASRPCPTEKGLCVVTCDGAVRLYDLDAIQGG